MEKPDVDVIEGSRRPSRSSRTTGRNRARRWAPSRRLRLLRCCGRGWLPHCTNAAARTAPVRHPDRGPGAGVQEGTRIECWRRWCAAARASSGTCSTTRAEGFVRSGRRGPTTSHRRPALNRNRNHDRGHRGTGWWSGRDSARLADSLETRCVPQRHRRDRGARGGEVRTHCSASATRACTGRHQHRELERASSRSTRPTAPAISAAWHAPGGEPGAVIGDPSSRCWRAWSCLGRAGGHSAIGHPGSRSISASTRTAGASCRGGAARHVCTDGAHKVKFPYATAAQQHYSSRGKASRNVMRRTRTSSETWRSSWSVHDRCGGVRRARLSRSRSR